MAEKNTKYRIIYSIILFGIIYFYFDGVTYSEKKISEIVNTYFGRGRYVILFILVSNYFTISIENKRKRDMITTICHMSYPFFLSVFNLVILSKLGILFKVPVGNIQYEFIQLSIFKYKLGLIGAYILSQMIFIQNYYIYMAVTILTVIITVLMSIIFFNWIILKRVKKLRAVFEKKRDIEMQEKKILKKIEIKEELEKIEVEKISKIRELEEQQIKEKIIEMNPEIKKRIMEVNQEIEDDITAEPISIIKLRDEVKQG